MLTLVVMETMAVVQWLAMSSLTHLLGLLIFVLLIFFLLVSRLLLLGVLLDRRVESQLVLDIGVIVITTAAIAARTGLFSTRFSLLYIRLLTGVKANTYNGTIGKWKGWAMAVHGRQ